MSWLNLEVTCEGIRPLLVRGTASGIAQWALGVEVTVVLFVVVFRGRRRCRRRRRCPRRRCVGRRRRGGPCLPVTAPHPTHPLDPIRRPGAEHKYDILDGWQRHRGCLEEYVCGGLRVAFSLLLFLVAQP